MSNAYTGQGTTLQYSTDSGGPYTDVAETLNISGPNIQNDMIEVTNDDSPNGYEEIIPSIKRGGEVTLSLIYKATVASVQAMQQAAINQTLYYWRILEADNSGYGAQFQAYVTAFSINERAPGDAVRASLTLRITGAVTFDDYS